MIGRILRGDTMGSTCGTRIGTLNEEGARFGAFVQACPEGASKGAIGVISAVRIEDDPLVRQLILSDSVTPATLADQRENRLVPVEIGMVHVGYKRDGALLQTLPPQPPLSLEPVHMLPRPDVCAFTERFDFFRLILSAPDIPTEELLAAALLEAAECREAPERRAFLVGAGRELARLLGGDLLRLERVLNLIGRQL